MSVTLVRQASVQETGVITVSVPKGTAAAGTGFGFPLPAQIFENAPADAVPVATALNGDPLPAWLRFDPVARRFSATAVPDGGFPIQVRVTVAGKVTVIVITERDE